MAEKRQLDVWVTKSNRVYREVRFALVADRLQRGLLSPHDRVSDCGTEQWVTIDRHPLLFAYLPQREPFRAEDQAEALEPVEVGLTAKRHADSEEDDPDMIPLIDVSLVLLIFFMMTAGSMLTASPVETPPAENARVRAIKPNETITISMAMSDGKVHYFLGDAAEERMSEQQLLDAVTAKIRDGTAVEAVVNANPWIPYEHVRQLLIGLETHGVKRIQAGVREKRIEEDRP